MVKILKNKFLIIAFLAITSILLVCVFSYNKSAVLVSASQSEGVKMTAHQNGVNKSENGGNGFGFYFKGEENNSPYNTDWSLEYGATTASNVTLTRNGVTTAIAKVGQGLIVKYSATDYYVKIVPWTVNNGVLPLQNGDVFTFSGEFKRTSGAETLIVKESTVTYINGAIFFDAIHTGAVNANLSESTINGVYFSCNPNSAPYSEDWSVEYTPLLAENIKIKRNGATYLVGNISQGCIVKYTESDYYIKFETWLNNRFPLQNGDEITINGLFRYQDNYLFVDATTFTYVDNDATVEFDGFSMVKGAAVRLDSDSLGIRFTALVGDTYDKNAKYYMMIVPEYYITRLNITEDYYSNLRSYLGEDAFIANMQTKPTLCTKSEGGLVAGKYYIRGSLTNIKFENMNTKFFAIAYYVKDGAYTYAEFNEGENVRSLVEISSLALNDLGRYSRSDIDILKGFVNRGLNQATGNKDSVLYNGVVVLDEQLNYIEGYPINVRLSLGIPFGADVKIAWSSSNPSVIAVDENGNVIGLKTGSATITAVCLGNTYTCEVTNQAGAKPTELVKKGNILSWNALAELKEYKVTVTGNGFRKVKTVKGLAVDLSTFGLTENEEYTVSVKGVINSIETNQSKLSFTYYNYDQSYTFAEEDGESLSIGVWNGDSHFQDEQQIKELADAGYDLIIGINPIWHGSLSRFIEVLDKAYECGVKIVVDVRSFYSDGTKSYYTWWNGDIFAMQKNTSGGKDNNFCTPSEYLTHPAIVSVLGWDEPLNLSSFVTGDGYLLSPENLRSAEENFTSGKMQIGREDLTYFVNLLSSSAVGGFLGSSDYNYNNYVQEYLGGENGLKEYQEISTDTYPILTDGKKDYLRKSYYYTLENLANKAKTEDKQFYYTILSSKHGAGDGASYYYEMPTEETLRWQMAVGIAFGASNLTHYLYTSSASDYTTMMQPVYDNNGQLKGYEKHQLFDVIAGVNKEYLAWDEIYRSYKWIGYSALDFGETGNSIANYKANALMNVLVHKVGVNSFGSLASVEMADGTSSTAKANNSKDLLVGAFENKNGEKAFMITNAGSAVNSYRSAKGLYYNLEYSMVDVDVKLIFESGYVGAWIINKGVKTYCKLDNNVLNVKVSAWDGVFVIPVKEKVSLSVVTINDFNVENNSISWSSVENAYAYEVLVERDGKVIFSGITFDNKITLDKLVYGNYVVTVTARNDGVYNSSVAKKEFVYSHS